MRTSSITFDHTRAQACLHLPYVLPSGNRWSKAATHLCQLGAAALAVCLPSPVWLPEWCWLLLVKGLQHKSHEGCHTELRWESSSAQRGHRSAPGLALYVNLPVLRWPLPASEFGSAAPGSSLLRTAMSIARGPADSRQPLSGLR